MTTCASRQCRQSRDTVLVGYLQSHWNINDNGGILVPSLGVEPVDLVPSLGDDGREPVDQREGTQQSSELARYVEATRGNQNQPNDAGRL